MVVVQYLHSNVEDSVATKEDIHLLKYDQS